MNNCKPTFAPPCTWNSRLIFCRNTKRVSTKKTIYIFLKLYLIDYAITVVLIFPTLLPSTQHPPTPSGNPPTIVHVHGSCV